MSPIVDIIVPTFNNREYLIPCVQSLIEAPAAVGLFRLTIVNNGAPGLAEDFAMFSQVRVIDAGKNLGWEGGLIRGVKLSDAPYVMFLNDDTFVPPSNGYWINRLLRHFDDPKVAAVGPSSNMVIGLQSIFAGKKAGIFKTRFLIGFCLLVRRDALDAVGGIDDSLPHHGDDIDLSIRLRNAGCDLVIDKSVFVFHHGFKTGQRVEGNYWNSTEMQEKTNHHLIRKHSLRTWYETVAMQEIQNNPDEQNVPDSEGDLVRKYVQGADVLELGCGATKTVPESVGMDMIPNGEMISTIDAKSVADFTGDVKAPLPFEENKFDTVIARHILEHVCDTLEALGHWRRVLKDGGRLIVAVPDETKSPTIPMNIEHVHVFTPDNLRRLMGAAGFKEVVTEDSRNNVSFVGVYTRNGIH